MTPSPMNEPNDIIARHLNGEPQDGDAEALQDWLSADPDNEAKWNRMQRIWLAQGEWVSVDVEDARRKIWSSVHARNAGRADVRDGARSRFRAPLLWSVPVLAAALIGLAVLGPLSPFGSNSADQAVLDPASSRIYSTGRGEHTSLQLVDGTKVVLGPATTLKIHESFSNLDRRVDVVGEAVFTVVHNSDAPFVVHAAGTVTRVLGTRFVVKAYPDDSYASVIVQEGKVSVAGSSVDKGVTLVANEMASWNINSGSLAKQAVDAEQYMAWIDGEFKFLDTPLRDVISQLERWYNVQIALSNPELGDISVTASSSMVPLDDLLSRLSDALDVRYVRKGRQVTLSASN